jgi:nucleotide-binding universal stress UspA family protein
MRAPTYHGSVLPFRRMLVALAGRDTDEGLLRYAAMLRAVLCGMETLCLHVTENGDIENLRRDFEPRIAAALPGARCEVAAGDLLDCVLDVAAARKVDLILLGHGRKSRRRSLARRLAMKAPCSVWMMPDGAPPTLGRILAPIDFSRRSADTLALATALAEAAGVDECLALHVHFNDAAVTFDGFDEILAEDRDRAFGLFIAPIDLHGVYAKPLFVEASNVAQAILRTAEEHQSDLIVMGTRGRSTSAAVLLGSETEHCMMTTQVPLLAVKRFGARLPLVQALRDERLRKRGDQRFT